jgi:hypothetical protein
VNQLLKWSGIIGFGLTSVIGFVFGYATLEAKVDVNSTHIQELKDERNEANKEVLMELIYIRNEISAIKIDNREFKTQIKIYHGK